MTGDLHHKQIVLGHQEFRTKRGSYLIKKPSQSFYLIKRILFFVNVDDSDWRPPPSVLLMGGEEGHVGRALHLAAVSVAGADLEGLLEAVS